MANMKALLAGGPPDLPEADRIHAINNLDEKVKISFGAGYEHFSHGGEFFWIGNDQVPVFRWCGSTKIAE